MRIFSKDSVWVTGLAVSVLLLLNIFIPGNSRRQIVLDRQIFIPRAIEGSAELPEIKKPLIRVTGEENTGFSINLELLGTLIGNTSLAFIYDTGANHPGLYRLNDTIGGFKIVGIMAGKVILAKDGATQELLLASGKRKGYGDNESFVFTDGSGTMVVDKFHMMGQILKVPELLNKIKILPLPDIASNKLRGFRIDNVPSGSIIEEVGIRNGDIIYSVQGQKMQSMQDALQMFNRIQNQSRIEVVLLREDKPVTLHYEIH